MTPDTVKIIPGEGMPLQKAPTRKGNMKVKFKVNFPTLSDGQKQDLKRVLGSA